MSHNLFNSLQEFKYGGKTGKYYSLPALEKAGLARISRLPVSFRVVLESALRNCDGKKIAGKHVRSMAAWKPRAKRHEEVPLVVARVIFGDAITTDHISPAGGIRATSPAGKYLQEHGVAVADFNT